MKFLYIQDIDIAFSRKWAESLTASLGKEFAFADADSLQELRDPDLLSKSLQEQDVDLIFIACKNDRRIIQRFLNSCRSLRIPYIFLTDTMSKLSVLAHSESPINRISAPVSRLEEEVHKAEIISSLMRYTSCKTILLIASDYGSKAQQNTNRIISFLNKNIPDRIEDIIRVSAIKNSDNLYKEVSARQRELTPDIVVWTASREYGLDDLIFGPSERYVISHSLIPVLLLNPRDDLFSLCD